MLRASEHLWRAFPRNLVCPHLSHHVCATGAGSDTNNRSILTQAPSGAPGLVHGSELASAMPLIRSSDRG